MKALKSMLDNGKVDPDCVLLIDEMYLQKGVQYQGGSPVDADENGELYTGIVVFMVVSLKKSVPFAIKACPESKISGDWLSLQIEETLRTIFNAAFNVWAVITDNHAVNVLSFKNLRNKYGEKNNSLSFNFDGHKVSKAFDKVWHDGLLFKLQRNGIEGQLLQLFKSYLSYKKQRVVINGFESEWGLIEAGVPQGSVLGPLFFLIYINDLENGIISNVKFFADDTSLFSIVTNPTLSAFELNSDLKVIENWASQWKMSFNPNPNKQAVEMLFSCKRSEQNHPPLFFNNVLVASASDHKHLGIILDCKLLLTKHISEKVAKARKGIGIIRHLSFHVPLDVLDQLYKLFVRPLLDYCDIIYHVPAITNPFNSSISLKYSMQSIESTQYQAALAVSGAWKGSNTSKLYEELGWESLTDRRWYRRLLQFYKIINDLAPSYLKDIIPSLRRSLHGHPRHVFNEFRCHSFTFMHSFFPDSIKSWNNIGSEFTSLSPISKFKEALLSVIRPAKKSVFAIHNPTGIKKLFQL